MVKSYRPSSTSQFVTLLVGLPGTALCFWVSAKAVGQAPILVACAFVALGVVLAMHVLFDLTLRIAMDAHSITRSWLFGSKVVPVSEIHRLSWGGARGVLILTIHYGAKRFIQISSNSLARQELRAIHNDVLVALGLEGVPMRPLFAEYVGYVDIDEMIKMKG
ncbi:hypothetical protein [Dyella tabacisoli]|uniref:Uncharacterized protein n=1 Tax=Dyella tabacisoli TaxID=2282381 RepID=A0A369UKE0_9GAMM|nr:hypothetical protein [Dyella tabacisoli]RDD80060.1 hypothetical protein DVJ77_19505 [Dyella tabacisoli]